ncbi:MAG: hypothetical protein LBT59_03170 [Clostridiales bacterium]|nr:hypothetical protein [Clostridiales bacterium]
MFWAFMIVATTLMFVLLLVSMSHEHEEKIERIKHGLPTKETSAEYDGPKRHKYFN